MKLFSPNSILLESSLHSSAHSRNYFFHSPKEILTAHSLEEIPILFARIEHALACGMYVAGYFAYECGYHFEEKFAGYIHRDTLPLAWFGVYESSSEYTMQEDENVNNDTLISDFHLLNDEKEYVRSIQQILKYISEGDTYQINFTNKYLFENRDSLSALYHQLRKKQHVSYSAYLHTDTHAILSFSPELFFHRNGNTIITKPMKGTAPRGRTLHEDNTIAEWLRNDEKNRSENLMIVDLLRNDLGRICNIGSVHVPSMFDVEKYDSLFQMTSTVSGTLREKISYYDIFRALFPCGSVTGAPKIRSMEIIHELEQTSRGVYCGAIGFFSPHDEAMFNVAIRTLTLHNEKGTFGIGSGIVADSIPEKEFEECTLKANFLTQPLVEFQLIETLLWKNGFTFFDEHLARLRNSAEYFGFLYDDEKIRLTFKQYEREYLSSQQKSKIRVRFLLFRTGAISLSHRILNAAPRKLIIKLALEQTHSGNRFLFHKTTHRALYDAYSIRAEEENIVDYIFTNEKNEITEGSYTNIFIKKNDVLLTPPCECGLLPGVYRNNILATYSSSQEQILTIEEMRSADAIYLCNSVRGWMKVTFEK